MATNSQLSTIESKKLSKQAEQKQIHRYGDHLEGYQLGRGRMGEKMQGLIKKWQVQKRHEEVKNSIRDGEDKDLLPKIMTHGHELRGRGLLEGVRVPGGGGQRGKNWDNCNSIINEIYIFEVWVP